MVLRLLALLAASVPANQQRWGGLSVRAGDRLVEAPAADEAVVRGYAAWPAKGPAIDGMQLTLLTAKTDYAVGESIHVLHVLDVSAPGRDVYIMGPKRPFGEYVDGKLATEPPATASYPWIGVYDGVVLPSPAIDYNFDITAYHFDVPGTHAIQWRLGAHVSNVIVVRVR